MSREQIELKSCPFCGGEAVLEYITLCCNSASQCRCKSCNATTKAVQISHRYSCDEEAAKAWNRRVEGEKE